MRDGEGEVGVEAVGVGVGVGCGHAAPGRGVETQRSRRGATARESPKTATVSHSPSGLCTLLDGRRSALIVAPVCRAAVPRPSRVGAAPRWSPFICRGQGESRRQPRGLELVVFHYFTKETSAHSLVHYEILP